VILFQGGGSKDEQMLIDGSSAENPVRFPAPKDAGSKKIERKKNCFTSTGGSGNISLAQFAPHSTIQAFTRRRE
jgi:hypothetical protein